MNLTENQLEIGGQDSLSQAGTPTIVPACPSIPIDGRDWRDIREDLISMKRDDFDWRAGRLSIYVYFDNDELLRVSRDAYDLYFSENALGKRAFPSLARMENDVLRMCLSLFKAPAGASGSFTSGGTESIFLAMKTARDCYRSRHGPGIRTNAIVPMTAHPAFDKAAQYLDVDVTRIPVGSDLRCDVASMREAINERTALIAGSAPCYPFGVFDPIAGLASLAAERNVWLHVDACLGGFIAPFARDEGWPIPEFDFSIPGVTSLSADLHKFGFAARGASVVLYRTPELHAHQAFQFDSWPRGSYATTTFLGSRPGGSIASAWAVMQYLGQTGYRRIARTTMETKHRLVRGIEGIAGLAVVRPSELNIAVYTSVDRSLNINAVADALGGKGWFVGRSKNPEGIHVAVNPVHAAITGQYLEDLTQACDEVGALGTIGKYENNSY